MMGLIPRDVVSRLVYKAVGIATVLAGFALHVNLTAV